MRRSGYYNCSMRWELDMVHSLFSYGTLQIPEVMKRVTGQYFPGIPGKLQDYARYKVKHAVYPGIIYSQASETRGLWCTGISHSTLEILDSFEGCLYEPGLHSIICDNGEIKEAWVYLVPESK